MSELEYQIIFNNSHPTSTQLAWNPCRSYDNKN